MARGTVYKRTNKKGVSWWISYFVGDKPPRKRIREYGGSTKAIAESKLTAIEKAILDGVYFPEKRSAEMTIGGLRKMWLEHAAQKRSLRGDVSNFKRIVEHFGESTLIMSLELRDVDAFKTALLKSKKRKGGTELRPATVNRNLMLLRAALRLAHKNGNHHRVEGIKLLPEMNVRDRICSDDEYARLVADADGDLRLAIVLGYATAMRLGEIRALTWSRIDLKKGIVVLGSGDTKTNTGRKVPLSNAAIAALKAWPRRLDGRLMEGRSMSPRFSRLCQKLGIVDLHFHDFRHTRLTLLRRAGVDVFTMKAISGHKTMVMLNRYMTVDEAELRTAINRAQAAQDAI